MATGSPSSPIEEEEPLLGSASSARSKRLEARGSPWRSKGFRIAPVLFAMNLACVITTTTSLDIMREFSCRVWYLLHYPDLKMPSLDQCDLPGPKKAYSISLQVLAILTAVGIIITYGSIGHYSAIFGRRPVLVILIVLSILNSIAFICAVKASGVLGDVFFALWVFLGIGSNPLSFGLVSNMYVVDSVDEDIRTSMLSFVEGCGILGLFPSYWLGGWITERFQNTALVFWCKLGISIVAFLYTLLILPESFSKAHRREARERRQSSSDDPSQGRVSFWKRPLEVTLSVFGPLRCLKPSRNPKTGRTNYGLVIIGASQILLNTGNGFLGDAYLIYVTVLYGFKPDETGLVLTLLSAARAVVLTFGMPVLMNTVRPLITRRFEKESPGDEEAEADPQDTPETRSIYSHRFDLWVARLAILYVAAVVVILGFLRDRTFVKFWFVVVALGAVMSPTMSSTVAACVPAVRSGEAMAAIDMVSSIGSLLGPLIIGAIMNMTVTGSHPQVSFFVCAGFLVASASVLLFVRDSDWFIEPPKVIEGEDDSESNI